MLRPHVIRGRSLYGPAYRMRRRDRLRYRGRVLVRVLPADWDIAAFRYWWGAEYDAGGRQIRPPRMSRREKDRWTVYEAANMLLTNGRTQLLSYMGNITTNAFAQYFAVGIGTFNKPVPGNTQLSNEVFRAAITLATIAGNSVDLSTYFTGSQAQYQLTNAGIFGNGATSTLGSGTLMAQLGYSYNNTGGVPLTNDYVMEQN